VHPALGFLALGLLAVLLLQKEAMWAAELLLVLTPLFFLQGAAVMHGLVASFGLSRAWLILFYLLLVFAMPQAEVVVASLGLADVWVKVRAKVASRVPRKD
jgi:hypothetical protein